MIDFGWIEWAPHVAARKAHQQLSEFSFTTPKGFLQQYLPFATIRGDAATHRQRAMVAVVNLAELGLPCRRNS